MTNQPKHCSATAQRRGAQAGWPTSTDEVPFGDEWELPEHSKTGLPLRKSGKRDRSLITLVVLAALYRTDQLKGHLRLAQTDGLA